MWTGPWLCVRLRNSACHKLPELWSLWEWAPTSQTCYQSGGPLCGVALTFTIHTSVGLCYTQSISQVCLCSSSTGVTSAFIMLAIVVIDKLSSDQSISLLSCCTAPAGWHEPDCPTKKTPKTRQTKNPNNNKLQKNSPIIYSTYSLYITPNDILCHFSVN